MSNPATPPSPALGVRAAPAVNADAARPGALRVTVAVLAALQAMSPGIFALTGSSALDADIPGEPAIVPAEYAFVIWTPIVVASLGYAVWQLPRGRGADELKDELAGPLAVAFGGFTLWLGFAASPVSWVTVPIFVAMLLALVTALRRLAEHDAVWRALPWWARVVVDIAVGVYAGWTSAAVWVNLTTAVAQSGTSVSESLAFWGQVGALAGATGTLCVVAWTTGARLSYLAAGAWALVGVAVGATQAGAPALAGIAAAGLGVFLLVAAARRLSTQRRANGMASS
jgi:hypothetical protein